MNMEQLNYEKIGTFIAERRKEKGMTQLQLAEVLGVTDRAVSKWERTKSFPDVSLLKPLCEALDISVSELLDGEKKPQEALSRQEADDVVIKGIRAYMARLRGKQMRNRLIAVCVLLILCAGGFLWHAAKQPIDFVKGNYEITKVEAEFEDGESCRFSLEGEFAKETESAIKSILENVQESRTKVENLERVSIESVTLVGLGTFYPTGYFDEKSQKYYSYYQTNFFQLQSFIENYVSDIDYQYEGEKQIYWEKSQLNVKCTVTEKPQEMLISYYAKIMKENGQSAMEMGFPDAYVEKLDILSLERSRLADLKDEHLRKSIQKEIDYHELYDYRIYRVITDFTYTEDFKKLGPQYGEGKREQYFLAGAPMGSDNYEIFYQSVPMII